LVLFDLLYLVLAACGGKKEKKFSGDTPDPGKGLSLSALPVTG
jgi:hypothetical protein